MSSTLATPEAWVCALPLEAEILFPRQALRAFFALVKHALDAELVAASLQTKTPHRTPERDGEHPTVPDVLGFLIVERRRYLVDFVPVSEAVDVTNCPRMATVADAKDAHAFGDEPV
eukprot:CAMPEP_0117547006 /NCGR_PEP_ID=MMETSP0784-20121206/46899_1 /TAXON_ID=39447 /ORGANISM="" /LENGTH=116 /DNA_ID=CAMNT_0005343893 /DNA_START=170 /DNA_END=521 /DNA_ORIENTATION=-